jgi:predicted transcriptional regulator
MKQRTENILNTLADPKTLQVLNLIAKKELPAAEIGSVLELTRKQYYTRLKALVESELVTKQSARYMLTPLGHVINNIVYIVNRITDDRNFYRIRALDSFRNLSNSEYADMMENLIDDDLVKHFLTMERKCEL